MLTVDSVYCSPFHNGLEGHWDRLMETTGSSRANRITDLSIEWITEWLGSVVNVPLLFQVPRPSFFTICTGNKDPKLRLPWCIWENQPIPGGCQPLPSSSRNLPYLPQPAWRCPPLNSKSLCSRAFYLAVNYRPAWSRFSVTLINYHVVWGSRKSDFPSTSSMPGPLHVEATCWCRHWWLCSTGVEIEVRRG